MVFGGGGKVGLYGRGKAENRAKVANLGLLEDVGATKVLGGTDPPDRQGILRSSPGKLLIKYTLENLF